MGSFSWSGSKAARIFFQLSTAWPRSLTMSETWANGPPGIRLLSVGLREGDRAAVGSDLRGTPALNKKVEVPEHVAEKNEYLRDRVARVGARAPPQRLADRPRGAWPVAEQIAYAFGAPFLLPVAHRDRGAD